MARLSPQKLSLLKQAMAQSGKMAEPIAVVGMGCRFAGATNLDEYWQLIRDGRDTTREIPSTRWDVDAFFDPSGATPGKMTTRWGGFLDDIDAFDAAFFGISPREAEKMDPQHRMLLEVVWEALEYGGIAPAQLRETATGVFVGVGGVDYSRIPLQLDNYFEQITAYSGTGNALSIAANRISYTFDLRGPSIAIDTACSSSLVAAHLAIRSLRTNECDAAIVGGVNAILTPETTLAFSQAHMLSADGKCRPFDHQANGYVRGEGCGVVVLKRLSDALSAGDHVLATIRGSAVNQDGTTSGITAPRGTAQVDVIRRALRDARCAAEDVSYVEAHGTATPLGDPIEMTALAEVFHDHHEPSTSNGNPTDHDRGDGALAQPCYIGSVKANIGHTETAAGMASLIKTIMMLRHQTIPRQTHFERWNPHVDIAGSRLRVATETTNWNTFAKPAIAGVSSFGFGGTNSHLVIEAAHDSDSDKRQDQSLAPNHHPRPKHVMTLSAKTPQALHQLASRFAESIVDDVVDGDPIADTCYAAAVGRTHLQQRLAVAASTTEQLRTAITSFITEEENRSIKRGRARADRRFSTAFLFPGQGAQFVGMGRQLYDTHRVFRNALLECDEILAGKLPERLLDVLFADGVDPSLLHQNLYTQPALFSIEYALAQLWRDFGIEPAVMIGHSIGDYVAACVAGVFSLDDGLNLVAHRGRLVQSLPAGGMMAVVFADRDHLADLLIPYQASIAVAAHNAKESVVLSGCAESLSELLAELTAAGVKSKMLEVSHAMHSPLLDPILDEFEQRASEVNYHSPQIPLISGRDGQLLDDRVCRAAYWRDHLRHTVSFVDATQTLQTFPLDAAIEMGPGTTLCGLASRMWDAEPIAWLPSLRRGHDDWDVMTDTLAEIYVRGATVDWPAFDAPWKRRRKTLPTYPFEPQRFWYDLSRRMTHHRSPMATNATEIHPLLGHCIAMAGDKTVFEVTVDAHHPHFLADHCLDQSPIVPAAVYVEQAMGAAKVMFGEGSHSLRDLTIEQALMLADDTRRVVQVHVGPDLRGQRNVEIFSHQVANQTDASGSSPTDPVRTQWTRHATATICMSADSRQRDDTTTDPGTIDRDAIEKRMERRTDARSLYELMAASGLQYGPTFQVISELQSGADESLAHLVLPEPVQADITRYVLHPVVMDGCLQSIAGIVFDPDAEAHSDLILPISMRQVRVFEKLTTDSLWVHARRVTGRSETDGFDADIDLLDDNGIIVAKIEQARVQRVATKRATKTKKSRELLYEISWDKSPRTPSPRQGEDVHHRWLVLSDASRLSAQFISELIESGHHVAVVHVGDGFRMEAADELADVVRFELDPMREENYQNLLHELASRSSDEMSVVDFWTAAAVEAESTDQAASASRLTSHLLLMFQALAKTKIARTVILTRTANAVVEQDLVSPAQTALWGFTRTAMLEMPRLSLRLIDLDRSDSPLSVASLLIDELCDAADDGAPRSDHLAFRAGQSYVGKLKATPDRFASTEGKLRDSLPRSGRFSLRLDHSGTLDGLHFVPVAEQPLQPDEVEIEVKSTGLNFSDVLKALELYPGIKDEIVPLGIECAGVISRIGDNVDRFTVGQRVMGVAPYSFASHTITAEYAAVATPDSISDDEAATIPITFLTAHHALRHLARLSSDEKVLIHAGAGGVGLAAIQMAQAIGAEVFATAGSDEKRDFLRSLGVEHVMDSRSLDFADEVLEITSGYGVDAVLNSLPGEAITKSISILASYGRFLEIGKTDIYQNKRIGLLPFQDNLSYHAIDLDRMLRQRPEEIRRLYRDLMPNFQQGNYRPLPLTRFPCDGVIDAFRYMAQRKNIGKVVVSMQRNDESPLAQDSPGFHLSDGTVLITGGLGALGGQVVRWAADQGATHVAILTRQNPSDAHCPVSKQAIEDVSITIIQGDVGDPAELTAALQTIPSSFPPIRGVIHAAGVLSDALVQTMDLEQLQRALAPKTRGAWNLHQVLTQPLDYFVMFSSISGTMGSPGQANYAAGNAFLDGLAHLRQRLGKPAISIAWGPWAAAGMAADPDLQRQLSERGMNPLAPATAIDLLNQSMRSMPRNVAVMDVDWQRLFSKLAGGASSLIDEFRPSNAATPTSQQRSRDEKLFALLQHADPAERAGRLQMVISQTLAAVMGTDRDSIDAEQPLSTLGLDSLMGLELRSALEAKLGLEIPVASFLDDPTVSSLAHLVAGLVDRPTVSDPEPASGSTALDAKPSAASQPRSKPGLVALGGSSGGGTPLFCMHPIGGDLRCYDALAHATQDRPVYGLRARGLQAGSHAPPSVHAMASDYKRTILEMNPDGPHCFVGWSTGGIFAYEVAKQMLDAGIPIESLVMIDTPVPAVFKTVDLTDNTKFLVDVVEFANHFANTSMEISYQMLREKDDSEAVTEVLAIAQKHGVLSTKTTPDYLQRLIDVCKQHVQILQQYQPQPIDLNIHLLRPQNDGMLAQVTGHEMPHDLGWGALANLQIEHIAGDHFTMMTASNAALLATKLDELIGSPAPTPPDTKPLPSRTIENLNT